MIGGVTVLPESIIFSDITLIVNESKVLEKKLSYAMGLVWCAIESLC